MEYGYYPEEDSPKDGKFSVGKLLKTIGWVLLAALFAFIIFRIILAETDVPMANDFIWTEKLVDAAENDPGNFEIVSYKLRSYTLYAPDESNPSEVDPDSAERIVRNQITDDGYFKVNNVLFEKSTGTFMFTLRFNTASVRELADYCQLSEVPKGNPYFFALESADGTFYTDYRLLSDTRFTYTYCRLVFEGIDPEACGALTLHVFYEDFVDLSYPFSSQIVYDKNIPFDPYKTGKAFPAKVNDKLEDCPNVKITPKAN